MSTPLVKLLDAPVALTWLDPVAAKIADAWRAALPRSVKDALHGVWLGHSLHAVLVLVPVGTWASAVVLDGIATAHQLAGGDEDVRRGVDDASGALVATGLVGAVPAAMAGLTDYADQHPEQKRVTLVHASANLAGIALFAASLVQRGRGRVGSARALALVAMAANSAGAALGSHLTYRWASQANHTQHVPHVTPSGWYPVARHDDLAEGSPVQVRVGETGVVLVRRGERVFALADVCSHLSGPLSGGEVVVEKGRDCIVCPWHQSTFALETGSVVHGPALSPQPVFDVRVVDGGVQVRLRELPGVASPPPVEGAVDDAA
ncbi:MAG: hypothetical protein AVDCRST_MAG35-1879 [uncultured Quadrisphaera sp.]|uniref:Rieske domain-containing protein n=1 Tax=uncultured Quadrisphaera sp. TaxID=904978 RepID=A0A6J4PQB6_9ACTN|nr:MAG: hypothetical protein AVDCRST_MAG35-1879 [uncultured Quadrisphaera sp.]